MASAQGYRLLKVCAAQLCGVLQHLFDLSLSLERIPMLWKTFCLVPVTKIMCPSASNDYTLVALTSHTMNSLGRLVMSQLWPPLPISPKWGWKTPSAFCFTMPMFTWTSRIALWEWWFVFCFFQPSPSGPLFCRSAVSTFWGRTLKERQVDAFLVSWIVDYPTI